DMNLVQQVWEEGNLNRAQAVLDSYIPERGERDLRGFEWRYLWKLCRDESKFSFTNFSSGPLMVMAPGGKLAAAVSGSVVKLRDFANRRERETLVVTNLTDDIRALVFSPSATNLLVMAHGSEVSLLDLVQNQTIATFALSNPAVVLAMTRDGKFL